MHAYSNRPHREGRLSDSYTTCSKLIDDAFIGRARELTESLKYGLEEAKQILVSALARYLNERFSVSRRRRLGSL